MAGTAYKNIGVLFPNDPQLPETMKKLVILIIFIQFWTNLYSQDFPPPANFSVNMGNDSIELNWMPPESKSFVHYNIYYGYHDGLQVKIGSTTDTCYTLPIPTFFNTMELGLTAEYNDPYGESDTIWNYMAILMTWLLPVEIDFEDHSVYGSGLTASIGAGSDNWELTEADFYSQSHSAAFNSVHVNSKASLITAEICLYPTSQIPTISFMCKLPPKNGLSDTLKLYYENANNYVLISDPVYNIDDWQLFTFTPDSMPATGFRFAFEATAGGGNGVYLDDIKVEDKTVFVEEHKIMNSSLKVEQNPVASLLSLDIYLKEKTLCSFMLYTIEGHLVRSVEEQFLETGNQKISIDISDLCAGLYIIEATLNQQLITKKIVKY